MHRLWRIGTAIVASAIIGVGAGGQVGAASSPSPAPTGLPPLADVPLFRVNTAANAIQPGPGPTGNPELAWKASIGEMHMTPILVDGLLIAGTNDGRLVALDARSGETRWDTALGVQIQSSLASSDGLVFASDGSAIHAVDIATGIERWSQPLDQASLRLNAVDGIVYIGTTSGVVGFDAPSGREVWRWDGGPSDVAVQAGPIADGVGYFAAGDGRVFAVDTRTGDVRWAVQTISTTVASGQVVGDTFYVSTNQGEAAEPVGEVYAVDRASGDVRWRFRAPSGLQLAQGPYKDGVLYASGLQDGIWALRDDGSSATVLWHVDAPEAHWPMTMVDDTLYEARTDGSVGAYARADGTLLWETPASGAWADGPIVSGGMLFVGDEASGMMAYADPDLIALLPKAVAEASPSPAAPSPQVASDPFTIVRAFSWADTGIGIPLGMDPGPDGLLYVLDADPKVTVIDPSDGHVVRRWGRQGAGPGEFDVRRSDDNPGFGDIAVAPDGRVYVADGSNHRVQVFTPDGTFMSQFGSFGTGEGQFGAITQLEVGPDGSVYVTDDGTKHLSKFTADGKFVWWANPMAGIAIRSDGVILGTCYGGEGPTEGCHSITLLDPMDGQVRERWPWPLEGDDLGMLNLDPNGNIFGYFYYAGHQVVLDPSGRLITQVVPKDPQAVSNLGNGHVEWRDTFWPAPVFLPDGRAFTFGKAGLIELQVTLADPAASNPFTIVRAFSWQDTGVGIPQGMAAGPDGLLYVLDTTPQVSVIDPSDGHVVRRWGGQGAGPGEFDLRRPDDNPGYGDIAVAPSGRVYVADGSNHRVQVFEPDGTFLSQFGSFGTGEGQFGSIAEIEVGPDGSVYTLDDPGLSRFTADGKFVWRMTQSQLTPAVPGYLHSPAVQQDGTVLLRCEGCFYTIEVDPIDGHVRGRIPTPGFEGSTLTLDPAGHMYLAQFGGEAQGVFDTAGHLLGIWYARVHNNLGNGHVEWGDTFTPAPVFLPDGRGYAFGKDGLLELKVTLPGQTASSASPGPPAPSDAPVGTWHTDRLTEDQVVSAFVAAGGAESEGHDFFAQLGGGAREYAVIGIRFLDGRITGFESGDGRPEVDSFGSSPRYEVSEGTLSVRNDEGRALHFSVALSDDQLVLRPMDPCPADCHPYWETLMASFPFHRDA